MGRRHRKKNNKKCSSSQIDVLDGNKSDELNENPNKKSKTKESGATAKPSPNITPVRMSEMQIVPYKVLFPTKIKTGTEILAALNKYFSEPREKQYTHDGLTKNHDQSKELDFDEDDLEITKVASKKHLFKKFKGDRRPKGAFRAFRTRGLPLDRDKVFQMLPLPEPPLDIWWPLVPGVEVPPEDGLEPVGNLNKPAPRDPEEDAILDEMRMPTHADIYEQFTGKRSIIRMPGPEKCTPEKLEEIMRIRTTMADLKHMYETGELIVRE